VQTARHYSPYHGRPQALRITVGEGAGSEAGDAAVATSFTEEHLMATQDNGHHCPSSMRLLYTSKTPRDVLGTSLHSASTTV
jgi:hypothetical protein